MTIIAYHFCGDTLRDGRPIPADGEWLVHDGPVVMCESGLHASRHPFDALQYAPGSILCRVECDDIVNEHDDKLVCRRRRIITRIDATELCRQAARRYALDVLHLWDAPDVVRRYLETGDESLRAAACAAACAAELAAALAAASAAELAAALAAACAAASAAELAAALAAARDDASAAELAAALAAACAAASAAELAAALAAACAAACAAELAAARDDASDAARKKQRDIFAELVTAAMEAA